MEGRMTTEYGTRSRRSILAAAAGGAAALAAGHLIRPEPVAAVGTPVDIDVDNASTAVTSITQGTADTGAFAAHAAGIGAGLEGTSSGGVGVLATTGPAGLPAVVGIQGDPADSSYANALFVDPTAPILNSGTYGFSNTGSGDGVGATGETLAGAGVVGFGMLPGSIGVFALGSLGAFIEGPDGAFVVSDSNRTGLHAHVGTGSTPPTAPLNTAVFASVSSTNQVGLEARGRIRFPHRSGRALIGAGKSSVSVSVSGMTSSNFAVAVLNSSRSGRWVRAVVCATGKITIYLNTAVTSSTYVAWLVLG
jgi:hypothetical protein